LSLLRKIYEALEYATTAKEVLLLLKVVIVLYMYMLHIPPAARGSRVEYRPSQARAYHQRRRVPAVSLALVGFTGVFGRLLRGSAIDRRRVPESPLKIANPLAQCLANLWELSRPKDEKADD
jgi:hypothetical protein